jgi:hypothetical protein
MDAHAFYTQHFSKLVSSDDEIIKHVNDTVATHFVQSKRRRQQVDMYGFERDDDSAGLNVLHGDEEAEEEDDGDDEADSESEGKGMSSVSMY